MSGTEKIVVNMTARVTLAADEDKNLRSYESLPAPVNHVCCSCNTKISENFQKLQSKLVETEV